MNPIDQLFALKQEVEEMICHYIRSKENLHHQYEHGDKMYDAKLMTRIINMLYDQTLKKNLSNLVM